MLDLSRVSQQIAQMAMEKRLVSEDLSKRLDLALAQLHLEAGRLEAFVHKLASRKSPWLLGGINDALDRTSPLPARPQTVTVVATDGSQIAPSHHEVVPAF